MKGVSIKDKGFKIITVQIQFFLMHFRSYVHDKERIIKRTFNILSSCIIPSKTERN